MKKLLQSSLLQKVKIERHLHSSNKKNIVLIISHHQQFSPTQKLKSSNSRISCNCHWHHQKPLIILDYHRQRKVMSIWHHTMKQFCCPLQCVFYECQHLKTIVFTIIESKSTIDLVFLWYGKKKMVHLNNQVLVVAKYMEASMLTSSVYLSSFRKQVIKPRGDWRLVLEVNDMVLVDEKMGTKKNGEKE